MAPTESKYAGIVKDLCLLGLSAASVFFVVRYALSRLDVQQGEDPEKRKAAAAAVMQRIDRREKASGEKDGRQDDDTDPRPRKEDLVLNQYEQIIASEVVAPEDIAVGFEGEKAVPTLGTSLRQADIGGLGEVIDELKESVIYPLTMPHLYSRSSSLLAAPSGVLLYGPPGCGKTMLAKALARESGANFINLHISTLTEKWFGDSNKLVHAVFSLARKLQPTIVFIDEIDAVLGQRRTGEHEASGMVKAEFMTHWDGLASANVYGEPQRILVLGATNRIQDIDEAILRRLPKKFPVALPTASQRLRILSLLLRDTRIDRPSLDLELLVRETAGLSGSDLKEVCRDAAMVPVREYIRQRQASGRSLGSIQAHDARGLRTEDFLVSVGGNNILKGKGRRPSDAGKRAITAEESSDTEEVSD